MRWIKNRSSGMWVKRLMSRGIFRGWKYRKSGKLGVHIARLPEKRYNECNSLRSYRWRGRLHRKGTKTEAGRYSR